MLNMIFALYGAVAYSIFFGTFLYAIGFVGNLPLPKTIDTGLVGNPVTSLVVNLCLIALFGVQHSVMARQGFKRMWTRFVPAPIERSTYVLAASLALLLLFWQWRPMSAVVWSATTPAFEILSALSWVGWGLVLVSTFLINHFELFGLRQVYARLRGHDIPVAEFRTPLLYKRVRHPIYLGFMIAFWSTPVMSVGHLFFALGMTVYIFIGIAHEERDLIALFGSRYRQYMEQVPMLLPSLGRRSIAREAGSRHERIS